MEQRPSRVRITAKGTSPAISQRELHRLKLRVEAIQMLQNEIDCKGVQADDLRSVLAIDMKKYGLTTLEAATSVANVTIPPGRSQTKISAVKLREVLSDDKQYNDCIEVSVTKAKKYLGEKEILAIADIIPAVPGKPVLKVTPRKQKAR